jgi:hypothetical protein
MPTLAELLVLSYLVAGVVVTLIRWGRMDYPRRWTRGHAAEFVAVVLAWPVLLARDWWQRGR